MGTVQSTQIKLVQLLLKNNDQYVPKQYISDMLDINRSVISSHILELEKTGYQIEQNSDKEYRLIDNSVVNEDTLLQGLQTTTIGKSIVHYESVASTQLIAHQLAKQGAEHGTVVVADEQTNGRGRMNRYWHSAKEKGIWLSIILRPTILPHLAPQFTLLTATVLANILKTKVKITPQIKWPNDLLIDHKKTAGILTEMHTKHHKISYIIVGIGINVNHTQLDLPKILQHNTTSILMETKQHWNKRYLIQTILNQFESTYETYIANGFAPIKTNWEYFGYKLGEQVLINNFQKVWQAELVGISEDGALLTRNKDNNIEKIHSAEIQWYNDS